ncbi:TlpA family protein disulfide reductase [Streptomyces sp. H27-S2]|uniref:TlpA family protein disulfide reductase n=1 Tax=Streptomyces antarcticus TaxID=2996458 RepID=UPI00226E2ABE|nr:redoxin family protein [Streptomyces sp. H27-S2]MCY0954429.1 redoxin family protein [Streptomyces sp. H27-S2]
MRSRIAAAALFAALCLPLTACTSPETTGPLLGAAGPQARPAERAVPDALRFAAKTVDGSDFDTASLAGKPVLLWFYGATCAECPAQAFETAALADRHLGRVHVVAVAGPGAGAGLQGFAAPAAGGPLTHLADAQHALRDRFRAAGVNTYVLLDEDGEDVYRGSGADTGSLDRELAALVGED